MASMTKYLRNRLIDHVLRGLPYKTPEKLYLALYTSPVKDDGTGDEIRGDGYARQMVHFGDKLVEGRYSNSNEVKFSVAKAFWGEVSWIGIVDQPIEGNVLFHGPTKIRKRIEEYDRISFMPGDVVLKISP